MANIPGTNLAAPVVPFTTDDTYPTHHAEYGKGGHRTVDTIVRRDSLPTLRREEGMTVWVMETQKQYRLVGGVVNSCWLESTSGGLPSVRIVPATFSLNSANARNRYMHIGEVPSNLGGWVCSFDGHISSVCVQLSRPGDCLIHIRLNGMATNTHTSTLVGISRLIVPVYIPVISYYSIQLFVESVAGVGHPVVTLELME